MRNDDHALLRAEIVTPDRRFVAHAVTVSDTSVFVRTPEPGLVGDRFELRLSLPLVLLDDSRLTREMFEWGLWRTMGEDRDRVVLPK